MKETPSAPGKARFADFTDHPLWRYPLLRYGLLCALFWTLAVAGFAFWSLDQQRDFLMDLARHEAENAFDKDLLMHLWSADSGEVYLPLPDGDVSPELVLNPSELVTTSSGKRLARVVPNRVREIFSQQQASGGLRHHLSSLTPAKAAHAPSDWERSALIRLDQGEMEISGQTRLGSDLYFRLMRPLVAQKACLACHHIPPYRLGEVLGGITVSVPMQRIDSALREQRLRTMYAIGALWILGLGMIGAGFGRIRFHEQERVAAEMALRDSEVEFRMLTEHANDVIWTMDKNGRYTYVSPSVLWQFGTTQQEALERSFHQTLTPESLAIAGAKFQAAVADVDSGRPVNGQHVELEHFSRDGSRLWFDVTFNAIYSPSGHFVSFMGVSRNITARKEAEAALRVSEEKYRSIFQSFQDIFYRTDLDGTVSEITPSVYHWAGYTPEEAVGMNVSVFYVDPRDRAPMLQELRKTGTLHDYEMKFKRKDGSIIEASLTARMLYDADGRPAGMEGVLRDITQRKQTEAKLRELSLRDELTGLNNRRGFMALAEQQMKGLKRLKQSMALIYADLDKMKWINDSFGHNEGDRALVDTSRILTASFRSSDIVARLGGDEFVGLAVVQGEADGEIILARLRGALEQHNRQESRPYRLSISFGLAMYTPERPCTLAELVDCGDSVMYLQKQQRAQSTSSDAA